MLRWMAEDYYGDTLSIAQRLLGCVFVRILDGQRLSGIIVETEAYLSENDSASHSFVGLKNRNSAMYKAPGALYVYSIHSKYCLNVVTEEPGRGAAVLIRALQPWDGIGAMRVHRSSENLRDLCTGPARLCQAMAITTQHNQVDLVTSDCIWIEHQPLVVKEIAWGQTASPRIGISSAQDLPYRYFIDGHQCVSGLARWHRTKRGWTFVNNG